MADTHATTEDPNAAPMHPDIKERFTRAQVAFCAALGAVAIVGGLVFGVLVVNN